jgi:hypothetical protein
LDHFFVDDGRTSYSSSAIEDDFSVSLKDCQRDFVNDGRTTYSPSVMQDDVIFSPNDCQRDYPWSFLFLRLLLLSESLDCVDSFLCPESSYNHSAPLWYCIFSFLISL